MTVIRWSFQIFRVKNIHPSFSYVHLSFGGSGWGLELIPVWQVARQSQGRNKQVDNHSRSIHTHRQCTIANSPNLHIDPWTVGGSRRKKRANWEHTNSTETGPSQLVGLNPDLSCCVAVNTRLTNCPLWEIGVGNVLHNYTSSRLCAPVIWRHVSVHLMNVNTILPILLIAPLCSQACSCGVCLLIQQQQTKWATCQHATVSCSVDLREMARYASVHDSDLTWRNFLTFIVIWLIVSIKIWTIATS